MNLESLLGQRLNSASMYGSNKLGNSVPRSHPIEDTGALNAADADEVDELTRAQQQGVSSTSATRWGPKPSFDKQMMEQPDTVRYCASCYAVFSLASESDRQAIEALMARAVPTSAPEIIIEKQIEEFIPADKNWVILVRYRKLEYVQQTSSNLS